MRSPSSRSARVKSAISSCSGSCPNVSATSRVSIAVQLRRRPRPAGAQPGLDRAEAREARGLAQRREPAGAEVDRVERERERGALLQRRALDVRRRRRLGRQRARVVPDRGLDDAHVLRCAATRPQAERISSSSGVRPRPPCRDGDVGLVGPARQPDVGELGSTRRARGAAPSGGCRGGPRGRSQPTSRARRLALVLTAPPRSSRRGARSARATSRSARCHSTVMSIAAARSHGGAQPRRVRARVESMLGIAASWRGGCSAERTSRPPGHARADALGDPADGARLLVGAEVRTRSRRSGSPASRSASSR